MSLKDRLREAMDGPPRVKQAELARACKVSPPTVNDWLSGKTKRLEGGNLLAVSRVLGVSAEWLSSGRGAKYASPGDEIVNEHDSPMRLESQTRQLTPEILASAETWTRYEEGAGRVFQPLRRAERVLALCRMIVDDGGSLSPEHAQQIIEAGKRLKGETEHEQATAIPGPGRR